MSKIYVTADHHFHHENIIKYCNRPFKNINHMNQVLIDNWNKVICVNDIVYYLGDLALTRDFDVFRALLKKLNGKLILVVGNHDIVHWFKISGIKCFNELKIDNFILTHCPLEVVPDGCINLCAHIHTKPTFDGYVNVGVDACDFKPLSLKSILK